MIHDNHTASCTSTPLSVQATASVYAVLGLAYGSLHVTRLGRILQ